MQNLFSIRSKLKILKKYVIIYIQNKKKKGGNLIMAARGSVEKEIVTMQILKTFSGSFVFGKEIRVPIINAESGEEIQIKITLTAAKDNVPHETEGAAPAVVENEIAEPTEEEKKQVEDLVHSLGF